MKIINLASWCRESMEKDLEQEEKQEDSFSFEKLMELNKQKEEKLARERDKANRSVVRSHRLKR